MLVTSQIFNRFCKGIIAAVALPALVALFGTTSAQANLTGAIFTTDSTCLGVDLNIYDSKLDVYVSGGPNNSHNGASLPDDCYYVEVTDPSGKVLLGTSVGTTDEKPYCVTGGLNDCDQLWAILRKGTTDVSGGAVAPDGYLDTPNPGGVYIVAISTDSDFKPSSTKYDAFKVRSAGGPPPEGGIDLTVTKTAAGAYDRTYAWHINKAVDKTLVKQVGGSVTFNYTATVTRDAGTDSGWTVGGSITINNANGFPVTGVDVIDEIN